MLASRSIGQARSEWRPSTVAEIAALPSEGAIAAATSAAVTPLSNWRALPSGKVREIWLIGLILVGLAPTERPVAGLSGSYSGIAAAKSTAGGSTPGAPEVFSPR